MPNATSRRLTSFITRANPRSPRALLQGTAIAFMRTAEFCASLAWQRPRNLFYGLFLETEALSLGSTPRIRGRRSIHIGRQFTALNNLWLEAVDYLENYSPTITIGQRVTCGDSVHIAATNHIRIGDDVLIGSRVIITDHNHGAYHGADQSSPHQPPRERSLSQSAQTVVENNVWIGDGVVLLAGSYIGHGSVIGANAVVRGHIPPNSIAAGNPAKIIRAFCPESQQWLPIRG